MLTKHAIKHDYTWLDLVGITTGESIFHVVYMITNKPEKMF